MPRPTTYNVPIKIFEIIPQAFSSRFYIRKAVENFRHNLMLTCCKLWNHGLKLTYMIKVCSFISVLQRTNCTDFYVSSLLFLLSKIKNIEL